MILFYLLVFVMPLTRHRVLARYVGELTVIKYLGLACFLYAIFCLATRRSWPPFFQTWQARWFVFLAVLAVTSFLTMGAPVAWEHSPFLSYVSFLLLFFITLAVVNSLRRLRWVLLAAASSVAFASLYVLREWQIYHDAIPGLRPGWVTGDPNYFTVSALLCLPLVFNLTLERERPWQRLFCLGFLLVTMAAVMLAASRGGLLGLVAAFLVVVWHSRRRARNLVLVTALLLPLIVAAPISPVKRFLNPNRGAQGSQEARILVWKAGLQMVWENPVLGVGLGNFKRMVTAYEEGGESVEIVAHNSYIEIAAEMGVLGLLAFLGVLFSSYRTLADLVRRTARSGPPLVHRAAVGIQAGLVGYAVAVLFLSAQYQKLFWVMVFLSMCLPMLVPSVTCAKGTWRKLHATTARS